MATKVRTVTLGEKTPVEVPAIEKELAKLWVEAAGTGPSAVLRACALNLLVYTSDQVDPDRASAIVSQLTSEHPSRVLILSAREDEGPAVEAQVSAHCNLMGETAREICCEQIILEAHGRNARRDLITAALQQIAPELPILLWWTGNPPLGTEDFNRLAGKADRLVLDSSSFDDPTVDIESEAQLLREPAIRAALGDLNWTRLTPWRELTAQFFDRADHRPFLERIDRVEIEFESVSPQNPLQGLLYVGWLASRLGWSFAGAEHPWPDRIMSFHAAGRAITVRFHGAPNLCETAGELFSVDLKVTQSPTARFYIGCESDRECATTRAEIQGEPPIERVVPMEPRRLETLMGEEMEILSHDRVFESALTLAAHMAR